MTIFSKRQIATFFAEYLGLFGSGLEDYKDYSRTKIILQILEQIAPEVKLHEIYLELAKEDDFNRANVSSEKLLGRMADNPWWRDSLELNQAIKIVEANILEGTLNVPDNKEVLTLLADLKLIRRK